MQKQCLLQYGLLMVRQAILPSGARRERKPGGQRGREHRRDAVNLCKPVAHAVHAARQVQEALRARPAPACHTQPRWRAVV